MIGADLVMKAVPLMAEGAKVTVLIAALGVAFGLPLGLGLALVRLSKMRVLVWIGDIYSSIMRGTPMLAQISILYFGLPEVGFIRHTPIFWDFFGDALNCAVLAAVMNTVAYTSEMFRSTFQALPRGYMEAAAACSMSPMVAFWRIRLPLAMRIGLPAYASEVVIIVKETSLASTITVLEITGYAKRLMSETFAVLEIFVIASFFYLALNFTCLAILRLIERRLTAYER